MLSYAVGFCFLNLILEDLNNWHNLGEFVSTVLAPLSFAGNIFFGFILLAKFNKEQQNWIIVFMSLGFFGAVILKSWIKKCQGKYMYTNWGQLVFAFISILAAAYCQEWLIPGRPCHPTSVF